MNMESKIVEVNIDDIIPNRFQPRLAFDEQGLKELANSIKEHGIIQPLVLRKTGDKYEIIAGERRYKASTMAGLTKVPAVIAEMDDNKSAEVALVENIQRRNLTAIEEAKSYKSLLDKGYLTQEQLAKKMGLSQSAVANKLRLLNLDDEVQEALLAEKISERHARALLTLEDKAQQQEWLHRIMKERLTVRQLDLELKKLKEQEAEKTNIPLVDLTPNIEEIINNAQDINPPSAPKDLSNMMMPDSNAVPTEPMPTAQPAPVESKGKFFNFLEDEAANMNMNETTDDSIFRMPAPEPVAPTTPEDDDFEILDLPSLAAESYQRLDLPTTSIPVAPAVAPYTSDENIIDPVAVIDTLDPNYASQVAEANGTDLKSAINKIRYVVSEIERLGFTISNDEIDFEEEYQFVIKIKKQ